MLQLTLWQILLFITISNLLDTGSQLFLKTTINSLNVASVRSLKTLVKFIFALLKMRRLWGSFICSTLSVTVWLFVLSKNDLNFAFSLDSIHYIFIALTSRFVLKEKVGLTRWLGTGAIIIGITLVSLSKYY